MLQMLLPLLLLLMLLFLLLVLLLLLVVYQSAPDSKTGMVHTSDPAAGGRGGREVEGCKNISIMLCYVRDASAAVGFDRRK